MNNLFIVLEGLSGSGKTTIGRIVAEKIKAEFYQTPPSLFSSIRDAIDKKADRLSRFLFYLAGVMQASSEISAILERKPVVCDRYFLTTLCFHRAIGLLVDIPDYVFNLLSKPDFTFLITCKGEVRKRRLLQRGLDYNDSEETRIRVDHIFLAEYRKHKLIEIDNSEDDPEIAVNNIIDFF